MSFNVSLIRLPGATEELRLWGQVGTLWELAVPYLLLTSGESRHLWETRPLRSDMGTILCLLRAHHVFPLQWQTPPLIPRLEIIGTQRSQTRW